MHTSKPFLIVQLRPEDVASDDEYRAFLRYGGIPPERAHRVRIEHGEVPEVDLSAYAGVIVGGGPYNVSDPEEKKSEAQRRAEAWLMTLLDTVVTRDTSYLGSCYGLGILGCHEGAVVSKERYGEGAGAVTIEVTDEGANDPLLAGLPRTFRAFTGHKEACQAVPPGAVCLARSEACPVQMIRVGKRVYGVQFHTELDHAGLVVRVNAYKHMGYFLPEEGDDLIARARAEDVCIPMEILRRFVERCSL